MSSLEFSLGAFKFRRSVAGILVVVRYKRDVNQEHHSRGLGIVLTDCDIAADGRGADDSRAGR